MKKFTATVFLAVLCGFAALASGPSFAKSGDLGLERFFGKYVGRSISVKGDGLSDRDLSVAISPHGKDGFKLDWTTVIRYTAKDPKVKSYSVRFLPYRKRPGIFYSAMRKNIFGHQAPADPLSGDPYIWAGIEKDTLTVSSLYITKDGGYELQLFKRTLTGSGMDSHFERYRDGKQQRVIIGKLERLAN